VRLGRVFGVWIIDFGILDLFFLVFLQTRVVSGTMAPHMANSKSADKTQRAALKRRVFNIRRSRAQKDSIKDILKTITGGDKAGAEKKLPGVYKAIDKAVKRGIIKKNNAARKKSRLARRLASME